MNRAPESLWIVLALIAALAGAVYGAHIAQLTRAEGPPPAHLKLQDRLAGETRR